MGDVREKHWRVVRRLDTCEPKTGFDRSIQLLANAAWDVLALRDLLPFQSVNRLCFDAGDRPYDRLMDGFVSFDGNGNFAVHRGSPHVNANTTVMLETTDAGAAILELLRVFRWV
jgi:Family of unknown function (DUF6193)